MCLIITEPFKIANKDIIAYKVLEKEECRKIYSGVYHLFSSIDDAILFKDYAQRTYAEFYHYKAGFLIVKAIIPKGTKYYVGKCKIGWELDDVFQHQSYGTKSVIYKELDA